MLKLATIMLASEKKNQEAVQAPPRHVQNLPDSLSFLPCKKIVYAKILGGDAPQVLRVH